MATIRFFHKIYGIVHELPYRGPVPKERELQEFFEKHLRTLTGIYFLASEYSTGQRHGRRIDTLGIDERNRPVVIEYKRSQDDNVINQGLEYLDWLEGHQANFRELVRNTLGNERIVDPGNPRLVCIASEFPRRDKVAARHCSRRIDLVRYRRYGDDFIALEWVYGGDGDKPARRSAGKGQAEVNGDDPDYSRYPPWNKTREETRTLFVQLKTSVESFGSVRTDAFKNEMSFKCLNAPGREKVIAYVYLRIREVRIRLQIAEKYLRDIPLEDGFSRPSSYNGYREITVRNDADIQRADPLLRAAHDGLSAPAPR